MADSGSSARRISHGTPGTVPRRPSYASVVQGQSTSPDTPVRSPPFSPSSTSITTSSAPLYDQHHSSSASTSHNRTMSQDVNQMQDSIDYRHRRGPSGSSPIRQRPARQDLSLLRPLRIPEYLREGSRYARKLEAHYRSRVRALQAQNEHATDDAVWSPTSAARLAPSLKGMTYELVENSPSDFEPTPLPSQFNALDKYPGLDVTADGFEVRYSGHPGSGVEAASIRADFPINPQCGIYYYEIAIKAKNKESAVAIGFSSRSSSLERLPGWEAESWAYHGDDGRAFPGSSQGSPYSKTFGVGDIVGCGIDFHKKCAFFTRNGFDTGVAFKDIKFPIGGVYPCIGVKKYSGVHIEANFGAKPFTYDIGTRVHDEEQTVARSIHKTSTASLHPGQTEAAFTRELVANFLAHAGYTDTLQAFTDQVANERKSLYGDGASLSSSQDPNLSKAAPRATIRHAILRGDINSALQTLRAYFSTIESDDPHIVFQLECQKFIELVQQASNLRKQQDAHNGKQPAGNGHSSPPGSDTDHAMEVDDESQFSNGSASTSTRNSPESAEYDAKNIETLKYGAYLREEYGGKGENYDQTLKRIFSLMPYPEPEKSPYGYLLSAARKTTLVQAVNSAILSSMHQLSHPALEIAVHQTETLIEALSQDGGQATYVNLQRNENLEQ